MKRKASFLEPNSFSLFIDSSLEKYFILKINPDIVLIDNNDSFTYNIVQVIKTLGYCLDVIPYTEIDFDILDKYQNIIISPGPDVPSAYPNIFKLIERYKTNKSILGVCLGFQAIAQYFGLELKQLKYPLHGIQSQIAVDTSEVIYNNLEDVIKVGRYHSWIVNSDNLSNDLIVTSRDENNVIMSIAHRQYDIKGVQYHPESIMTPDGPKIIKNWIESR